MWPEYEVALGTESIISFASRSWGQASPSVIFAGLVLLVVGLVLVCAIFRDKEGRDGRHSSPKVTLAQVGASAPRGEDVASLKDKPWLPAAEVVHWREACDFDSCPWNFDGCETLEHVFERIWRDPPHRGLYDAGLLLLEKCKDVRVAKCDFKSENIAVQFLIVYVLKTGAELFAGAPRDFGVGVKLPDEDDDAWVDIGSEGLRSRTGGLVLPTRQARTTPELPLPCLADFYRIHDGIGVLLNHKHIPVLLDSPYDSIKGSCFYVYPVRAIRPFGRGAHLVKFARVDKKCIVCASMNDVRSGVIYVHGKNDLDPDGENPLEFVADTISNIAEHNALPARANPYGLKQQ